MLRNTEEARRFNDVSEKEGVSVAVVERDGPFGDYSQAPASGQPDPRNVIKAP